MTPQPPPGQGPIDPRDAFSPPPPPPGAAPGAPAGAPMPPRPPQPMMMPPPAYMPPPPNFMPPPFYPPPPKRGSLGRTIFLTVLILLLVGSIGLNFLLLAVAAVGSGAGGSSATLVEGSASDRIAMIPVSGAIMGDVSTQVLRFIDEAEKDSTVKAVVLYIDSPGGSVTSSDEIHHQLKQLKTRRNIPIVVAMGSMATSGGYYVACAGDYIFAQPSTITGNIGVLMPRFNVHKLMEEWGIEETTIEATGADFKNAGSMFKPEHPEDTAYLQRLADQAFTQFKQVVLQGRGNNLRGKLDQIANGKVYMAQEALSLGLIDRVGYSEDAFAHAAQLAGISNPTIFKYQDPPSLMETILNGRGNVPLPRGTSGVQINGVNVNLDRKLMHDLLVPRVLYMWQGQ